MSAVEQKPNVKKKESSLDKTIVFGEVSVKKPAKEGIAYLTFKDADFLKSAEESGLNPEEVKSVFSFGKKYNEEFLKKSAESAASALSDDESLEKVVIEAAFSPTRGGKTIATFYRNKSVPDGDLTSGKKKSIAYVAHRLRSNMHVPKSKVVSIRDDFAKALND